MSTLYPSYISITRKRVKNINFRIRPDGEVVISAPLHIGEQQLLAAYQSKASWIEDKRLQLTQRQTQQLPTVNDDQIWLFDQAFQWLASSDQYLRVEQDKQHFYSGLPLDDVNVLYAAYLHYARSYLPRRAYALAKQHQVAISVVKVGQQRRRWGSCSSAKNINLNWRLILMPEWVGDYVICHELAHTRHMNHSPAFWRYAEQMAPKTAEAEAWLKQSGSAVMQYLRATD